MGVFDSLKAKIGPLCGGYPLNGQNPLLLKVVFERFPKDWIENLSHRVLSWRILYVCCSKINLICCWIIAGQMIGYSDNTPKRDLLIMMF